MSTLDLDLIRTQNPIVDVVREVFPLRQSGQHWIRLEHDSLVVNPRTGWYHWNSREEHGDVVDFVGRYHLGYGGQWSSRDPQLFMEVVAYLANRAGIVVPSRDAIQQSAWLSERELIERLHMVLGSG